MIIPQFSALFALNISLRKKRGGLVMKIPVLLIISILVFLTGSIHGQIPVVDVHKCMTTTKQIDLCDITEQLTYIRLSDANQTALIGKISKITANDSYFIIYDDLSKKLFLYDAQGNFKRLLLESGKGPFEYIGINSIDINQNNDILVLVNSERIIIVNAENDRKSQFAIRGSSPVARWLNGRIVIFRPYPHFINNKGFEISFLEKDGKVVHEAMQNAITGISYMDMSPYYSCGRNAGELYYWNAYNDTVYTITDDMKVLPRLVFKHGRQKYSNEDRKKGVRYDPLAWKYVQDSYRESGNMAFSSFAYGQKGASIYINRLTGEGHNVLYDYGDNHFLGFKNNLDGGVEFWPSFGIGNGILFSYTDPGRLTEVFQKNQKAKIPVKYPARQDSLQKFVIDKITLSDNPIIIKLKTQTIPANSR
jgi:hypothetical protein